MPAPASQAHRQRDRERVEFWCVFVSFGQIGGGGGGEGKQQRRRLGARRQPLVDESSDSPVADFVARTRRRIPLANALLPHFDRFRPFWH